MSDYGFGARVLHRLALGSGAAGQAAFDLERSMIGRYLNPDSQAAHVFVSGLARSGTTILMRALFESGAFASLTYRDMPFVMAPNTWARLSGRFRSDRAASVRAHGDGIMVDFDSPEALDEVFWRVFEGDRYIRADRLEPMEADSETIELFRTYVALILQRHDGTRYLSKNNNNILRIGSLVRAFPNAAILIPYRRPEQQALSLLKQHERFCARHADDPFTKSYMGWLVHHEFGADHRPFAWAAGTDLDPSTLDYWVEQWIGAYGRILIEANRFEENIIAVGYERLCEPSAGEFARIAARLGLKTGRAPDFRLSTSQIDRPIAPERLARADEIYAALGS